MRLIIDAPEDKLDAALELAKAEWANRGPDRYNRLGWGWNLNGFWTVGIKGGLSLKWMPRP